MAVKKSELYTSLRSSCDEAERTAWMPLSIRIMFSHCFSLNMSQIDLRVIRMHKLKYRKKGGSFDDLVEAKGRSDIGDRINKVIRKLADENIKKLFCGYTKIRKSNRQ